MTKIKHIKPILIVVVALASVGVLAGCTSSPSSITKDQNATNAQLKEYEANQPIPQSDFSQYRQTLIDVENAEIHGVATTTFFYNLGSNVPIKSCPSIGYPVASTSQLTNPEQIVHTSAAGGDYGYGTVGQAEPNGTYTGDSTGTYVVCVLNNGDKEPEYWEGDVETEGGPAHFDKATGQIVDDGSATVTTKNK